MPEEIQTDKEEVIEESPTKIEETNEVMSTPEQPTEGDLPDSASDRTKEQFEKLKAEKEELKRQLEARKDLPSVLDFLSSPTTAVPEGSKEKYQAPVLPQAPVAPVYQPQPLKEPGLVDENGYVNTDVLTKRLARVEEAEKRATEAEKKAMESERRISEFEQNAQTKELYQSYPELNPHSKIFNEDAYKLVRNELSSQIMSSGTRDAMKAASEMSKYFRKEEAKEAVIPKALEQRSQATVSGSNARPVSNDPDLIHRRDPDSIQERLRRIGA